MTLGELIAVARECKGWTLRDLQKASGVSNPLISQIETGKVRDPGFSTVVRLVDALGLSLDRAAVAERSKLDVLREAGGWRPEQPSSAINDIAVERKRQVEAEGWTPEHDDAHNKGEMARAAGVYAVIAGSGLTDYRNALAHLGFNDVLRGLMEHYWPWSPSWFKPTNRRRDLVKAGALIVAEIERLDRLAFSSDGAL